MMIHDSEWNSWTLLVHGVNDLIIRGKRSWEDYDALKRAVQLFKEGRLEGVVTKGFSEDADLAEIFAFFDTPIENVGLIEEAVVLLRERGIRLVGEILRFQWEYRFKGGEAVHQLFLRRHIPVSTDPWSLGWRPAYLTHPAVRAALMLPGTLLFERFSPWDPHPLRQRPRFDCHDETTTPFIGQSIARLSKGNGQLLMHHQPQNVQKAIDRVPSLTPLLHAAMYIPEDYVDDRNDRDIPEVVAYTACAERARLLLEKTMKFNFISSSQHNPRPATWMQDKWPSEEAYRRRALVEALKAEAMSPHFFAVATSIHHQYFRDTRTIREFLGKTPASLFISWDNGRDIPEHLAAWGLKLGMTKEELDELFGPAVA